MIEKCIICGFETKKIQHPKFGNYYYYCNNCEFISKDKRNIISRVKELEIYNYHNNSIDDPKYVEYFYDFLNNAFFPYVNINKYGLDFGSGHYYGAPSGIVGVAMSGLLGWYMLRSMYETEGFVTSWIIHFMQDLVIFSTLLLLGNFY